MPHMSPIGLLSLFKIFSLVFSMMNIMNYYLIIYKSNYKLLTSKSKKKDINWMW